MTVNTWLRERASRMDLQRRPRVGLALSGGGARGLAHIGVLKVLERKGIAVDLLAGTSIGGVIAAGYAAGMRPDELEAKALETGRPRRLLRLADPGLPRRSLLKGRHILAYLEGLLGGATFADLSRPLALVTVDLNNGQEIILRDGPLALAVRATVSIPGLLAPVDWNGCRLVDGGLLNNLPVDVARGMGADVVIAVDVTSNYQDAASFWQSMRERRFVPDALIHWATTFNDAFGVMMAALQEQKLRQSPPDLLIRPVMSPEITMLTGYGQATDVVAAGEAAAKAALPQIRELIRPPSALADVCPKGLLLSGDTSNL